MLDNDRQNFFRIVHHHSTALPDAIREIPHLTQPQGRHFKFFLGVKFFYLFFNATGLLKNWKKQHFLCSNLTLFIVPFFFLSFVLLFSLFSSFFRLFFFFLGEGTAPQPPSNDAPAQPLLLTNFLLPVQNITMHPFNMFVHKSPNPHNFVTTDTESRCRCLRFTGSSQPSLDICIPDINIIIIIIIEKAFQKNFSKAASSSQDKVKL